MRSSKIKYTCARSLNRQLKIKRIKKSRIRRDWTHCERTSGLCVARWRTDTKALQTGRRVL